MSAGTPVVPRPAATVALLRPTASPSLGGGQGGGRAPGEDPGGGLEVLLTHRPSTMAFAPDVHVFPGGRVDATDADPVLVARSVLTADDAARALGSDMPPSEALATYIAAIREVFEETGVLLADHASGRGEPSMIPVATGATQRALDVGRAELLHVTGAFAPMVEALDLRLRTDLLVPFSRWVTPSNLPRRFDTRFFAAALPAGAEVSLLGDEVAGHAWHTPRGALDEMAAGTLAMWLPTSSTLQQLEHATSIDQIRSALTPRALGDIVVEELGDVGVGIVRVTMPAGGGISGQPVCAYLVGTASVVLVDPGDPTGPALDRAIDLVAERGGAITAVALTQPDPDHAAGSEAVRERLDVPVFVGRGGGHDLPFPVSEIGDGDVIDAGELRLRVVATPGPRPDHLAFVVEAEEQGVRAVIAGDLDGIRGARSIPGPSDRAAWSRSVARLRSVAPDAVWLSGHPS